MPQSLLKSKKGNIAILAGLLMFPAILTLGASYDVMRATAATSKLRTILEGAALSAASLTNTLEAEAIVKEYVRVNLGSESEVAQNLTVNVNESATFNSRTVEITASSKIKSEFLKMAGVDYVPVTARTSANQSRTTIELSMVMDISSSMSGSKLTNLKDAAADFIDNILTPENINETSINLVPFGGTVNIGPLFQSYAVPLAAATVDPTETQYNQGFSVPNGLYRFSNGDKCIEVRDSDYGGQVLPANSRSQVPHFWKWSNFNPWCPTSNSAILMNTNKPDDLKTHIAGMSLSDGTGMNIGMMWGIKSLSPAWKGLFGGDFTDRPLPYGDDVMKVLVVMTDGEITNQVRPKDYQPGNTHSNRPASVNQDPALAHIGRNHSSMQSVHGDADNQNEQQILKKGNASSLSADDNAVGQFKRMCDSARQNDVIVYTIGFQIKQGNISDEVLAYCASDPSKYYFIEDLDIESAFQAIAASVNSLRIVG
ncbi:MAG: pilus assembly protein TadG-related protein [Pseudomonadota bacterium]